MLELDKLGEDTKTETEEECPNCKVAVALGMSLNICREIKDKETCDKLFKQVTSEEISPKELFNKVKEIAKDNPEKLDILRYIEGLAGELEIDEP